MNVKYQQKQPDIIKILIMPFSGDNLEAIKTDWLALEKTASTNFFLSWKWISSWLTLLNSEESIILIQAIQNKKTVGLGFFVEKNIIRHGLIKSKQWFLHRTGDENKDQIWIENNDFLICNANKENIAEAIWKELLSKHNYVDEFIIAIHKKNKNNAPLCITSKYSINHLYNESGYNIDLTKIVNSEGYLSTLSKNTRQQIKRSIKALQSLGNLNFHIETDPIKQNSTLKQCQQWHINKWANTETPSGFSNKNFIAFHNQLILTEHSSAKSIVATLSIKNEIKACLYCFLDNETAYFYLSCLEPTKNNKIKLGLTIHYFFLDWLLEYNPNITKYDLLAGEARYKKSLSNKVDQYSFSVIQKKSLKFMFEKALKKTKNTIKLKISSVKS